jgi:hypothetical protein
LFLWRIIHDKAWITCLTGPFSVVAFNGPSSSIDLSDSGTVIQALLNVVLLEPTAISKTLSWRCVIGQESQYLVLVSFLFMYGSVWVNRHSHNSSDSQDMEVMLRWLMLAIRFGVKSDC